MKRLTAFVLVVASAALLPARAGAQTDTCPGFRDLVEAGVPKVVGDRAVMAQLLAAQVGPQLSQNFDVTVAEKALGDSLRPSFACRDATRPCVYHGQRGSVLLARRPDGVLTYLNPARRFQAERGVANPVTEDVARRAALDGIAAFGVPPAEVGPPLMNTLMAGTQDAALKTPTQVLRAEVHAYVSRFVGGVLVLASRSIVAVDAEGRIARIHVEWPDFSLVPGLSVDGTLPRTAVVEQVLAKMASDNPCGSVNNVIARIVYVPASFVGRLQEDNEAPGREKVRGFVPALVVLVVPPDAMPDGTTLGEQQFVVPLLGSPQ